MERIEDIGKELRELREAAEGSSVDHRAQTGQLVAAVQEADMVSERQVGSQRILVLMWCVYL